MYHIFNFGLCFAVCDFVQLNCLWFELLKTDRFFRDVQTLVDASFARNVLLNGAFDRQLIQITTIVILMRDPSFWRYDLCSKLSKDKSKKCVNVLYLNHSISMFQRRVQVLHIRAEIFEFFDSGVQDWTFIDIDRGMHLNHLKGNHWQMQH